MTDELTDDHPFNRYLDRVVNGSEYGALVAAWFGQEPDALEVRDDATLDEAGSIVLSHLNTPALFEAHGRELRDLGNAIELEESRRRSEADDADCFAGQASA